MKIINNLMREIVNKLIQYVKCILYTRLKGFFVNLLALYIEYILLSEHYGHNMWSYYDIKFRTWSRAA